MEIGPRALGARSILADPRPEGVKERLNFEVKHREAFRPYAPAVLEERCGDYFEPDTPSPFMLRVQKVRPGKAKAIPGVVHVDGTARAQTVGKSTAPLFRRTIEAFERRTGVPMVLNTSLNVRGEPMVCTPRDALRCFYSTGLDALAIGPFLVQK
jgi:carbamoyltransferase